MGFLKPWHIIVLLVVILLLFGGNKLPDHRARAFYSARSPERGSCVSPVLWFSSEHGHTSFEVLRRESEVGFVRVSRAVEGRGLGFSPSG